MRHRRTKRQPATPASTHRPIARWLVDNGGSRVTHVFGVIREFDKSRRLLSFPPSFFVLSSAAHSQLLREVDTFD
jgi:hypothetical protein